MIDKLLALALAIAPKLIGLIKVRKAVKPKYYDAHHWSLYDRQGNRVPEHCVYCRQLHSEAAPFCPGSK